jgi:hypothetical protein
MDSFTGFSEKGRLTEVKYWEQGDTMPHRVPLFPPVQSAEGSRFPNDAIFQDPVSQGVRELKWNFR